MPQLRVHILQLRPSSAKKRKRKKVKGNIDRIGPPRWLRGKESACNAGAAGDAGLMPGPGRSWRSCLQNPMDRGAWQATVHSVAKS